MTLQSNIDEDGGGWVQLDPQNREEWEAFWLSLLPLFEEENQVVNEVINGDRVQVKFRDSTTPKLGTVEIARRADSLVSVRMDSGEVWTVGLDELLPVDAPIEPVDYELDTGP